jgi:hypothetical protein
MGTGVLATGSALHALALHEGPLTLVQPLLVAGVLFALPASRWAGGPNVSLREMRWAALLVCALSAFLVTATPSSQPTRDVDGGPATAALALSLLGILACLLLSQIWPGKVRSSLLGVSAGIALAGAAAMIKVCTDLVGNGAAAFFGSWQPYALLAVGAMGVTLSQMAYHAGPMTASLPAINSVNPLVSVALGTVVFDERFRSSPDAIAVEVVSLVCVLGATVVLSRRSAGEAQVVTT